MSDLSRIRRLDTGPGAARDQDRLVQHLDELFNGLVSKFRERLGAPRGTITVNTARANAFLRFDRVNLVDATDGNIAVYLPQAGPKDAGRTITVVKTNEVGDGLVRAVTIRPVAGQLVNGLDAYYLVGQGAVELIWDGRYWWSPELPSQPRYHDTAYNPLGLWQLDTSSWTDSSGYGRTLTTEAGTPGITSIQGLSVRWFGGATNLYYNTTTDSGVQLTGDMTIEALVSRVDTTARTWISHEANSELEVNNTLYSVTSGGTQTDWITEHGAGTNDTYSLAAVYPIGVLTHFAVVRRSNIISYYFNGNSFLPVSSALTTPTGGTSGKLRIGADAAGAARWNGGIASVKLIGRALTEDEVKRDYNYTLGPLYGYV